MFLEKIQRVPQGILKLFLKSFKYVQRKCQVCFKEISKKVKGCFKNVSRKICFLTFFLHGTHQATQVNESLFFTSWDIFSLDGSTIDTPTKISYI